MHVRRHGRPTSSTRSSWRCIVLLALSVGPSLVDGAIAQPRRLVRRQSASTTSSGNGSAATAASSNATAPAGGSNSTAGTIPTNVTTVPARTAFGLRPDGLMLGQTSGIQIGFLPDWSFESPITINQKLGKAMSVAGDYINLSSNTSTFSQIGYHASEIGKLAGISVYAPAIIPSFPLSQWTPSLSQSLASECKSLNQRGITVWLRFAFEMNGYWMAYGLDPTTYINTFRDVANAVRAVTNTTYMLWSPNIFGGATDSLQGYSQYYPGDSYVDLAGLSFYSSGDNGDRNTVPDSNLFSSLFTPFYKLYSSAHWIVISETSAPYHNLLPTTLYSLPTDSEIPGGPDSLNFSALTPADGGSSEYEMKSAWIHQIVGNATAQKFPKLLAVSFFNYVKTSNSSAQGQLNDYRFVSQVNSNITTYMRTLIGNETAFENGYKGAAPASLLGGAIVPAGLAAMCAIYLVYAVV